MVRAAKRDGLPVTCDVAIAPPASLATWTSATSTRTATSCRRCAASATAMRCARGARRRHDRRGLLRPHAGRRRREAAAVRRSPSRARPGSSCCCRSTLKWGARGAPAARADARAHDLRAGAHPRRRRRAPRRRRAGATSCIFDPERALHASRPRRCAARARTRRSSATSCRASCAARWCAGEVRYERGWPLQRQRRGASGRTPRATTSSFSRERSPFATATRSFGTPERLRDERDQRVVRAPVERRRGDAELEALAVQPGHRGALRAGLDVHRERPAVGRPPRPRPLSATRSSARGTPSSTISRTCARTTTNSGDRSTLPIGGMKRRKKP